MHTPFTKTVNLYLSFNFQVKKVSERGVRQNIILITGGGQPKDYVDYGGEGGSQQKDYIGLQGGGGESRLLQNWIM